MKFDIIVGRIETLKLDAIVNAANSALIGGSGVDGAIRRAAGPELDALLAEHGPLAEGAALVTPGFNLDAKHVIHTVAPIYAVKRPEAEKRALLASCYRECLMAAAREGLGEIAFPALGTGAFGWPKDLGCEIAVETVSEQAALAPGVRRVVFCCFVEDDAALYRARLAD